MGIAYFHSGFFLFDRPVVSEEKVSRPLLDRLFLPHKIRREKQRPPNGVHKSGPPGILLIQGIRSTLLTLSSLKTGAKKSNPVRGGSKG